MNLPVSKLTKHQVKNIPVLYQENGNDFKMQIDLRYDDRCNNGHNTFSLTASIWLKRKNGRWIEWASGSCHDKIVEQKPELEHLVRWHLTSSNGPMHYVANSIHHASQRDPWGKLKGEPYNFRTRIYFDSVPIKVKIKQDFAEYLKTLMLPHAAKEMKVTEFPFVLTPGEQNHDFLPHYSLTGYGTTWYEAPFQSLDEAQEFLKALQECSTWFMEVPTAWGKGKLPDIDAARTSACWPEAQLSDFTREKLEARLPALMNEFKEAMEGLGFTY